MHEISESTHQSPRPELSATSLAAGIRSGDRNMEFEFCRRYYDSVQRILQRYTREPSRADDITQDVLLTVLVRLRTSGIDHPERLTSFVHQTARFSYLGWLRQNDNRLFLKETLDDHPNDDRTTEQTVLSTEQREVVAQLVRSMEVERDREVLHRFYLCDDNKQNICDTLELTPIHFDRVISRARKRLRRIAEQQHEDVIEVLAT